MADTDTMDLPLVVNDWVEVPVPDSQNFTVQNPSSWDMRFASGAVKPTVSGNVITPRRSAGRLTSGKHWLYSTVDGQVAAITVDDRS